MSELALHEWLSAKIETASEQEVREYFKCTLQFLGEWEIAYLFGSMFIEDNPGTEEQIDSILESQ